MAVGPRGIGEFCWINVMTPDPETARAFYADLLGWSFPEMPGMGYLIQVDGKDVGGLFKNVGPDGQTFPPGIGVMVRVASADATSKRAGELGGRGKPAFDVGPQGRMAELVDPVGAMIDVWEPKASPGMQADPMKHGVPSWFECMTPDVAKASAFYQSLFGWTVETAPMGDFDYTMFKLGSVLVGGMMPRLPHLGSVPPHWAIYVTVDDADAAAAKAARLGAEIMMPPMDIPDVGRFAGLGSPQGVMFYVLAYPK